ncbi:MAG TPA: hypothetical protein PLE54_01615 [Burkholderiaceae bacterium]|nr:hypothetical protein [Burkholderiaceae bacterium]HQR69272.1 hypothetical protein [Burkholderiaceae bacterium]
MTMKKTELEKRKGLKIANALRQSGPRFDTAAAGDRRAQRERDRAAGLVPFAVKLPGELLQELHETSRRTGQPLNELVERLLRTGLETERKER